MTNGPVAHAAGPFPFERGTAMFAAMFDIFRTACTGCTVSFGELHTAA